MGGVIADRAAAHDHDAAVVVAGHDAAVGQDHQGIGADAVDVVDGQFAPLGGIPLPHRAVDARRDEPPTVRRPGHRKDVAGMSRHRMQAAAFEIEHPDQPVERAGRDPAPVGRERRHVDVVAVAGQDRAQAHAGHVPDARRIVAAGGHQQRPVMIETAIVDQMVVQSATHGFARRRAPQDDTVVVSGGGDPVAVRRDSGDRTLMSHRHEKRW